MESEIQSAVISPSLMSQLNYTLWGKGELNSAQAHHVLSPWGWVLPGGQISPNLCSNLIYLMVVFSVPSDHRLPIMSHPVNVWIVRKFFRSAQDLINKEDKEKKKEMGTLIIVNIIIHQTNSDLHQNKDALAGVAQWIGCGPVNQRVIWLPVRA